jgi:hypothetical protein
MATAARTSQFIRCARLVVLPAEGGEIEIANMIGRAAVRMRFDVRRSFDATDNTPQTATIWLYNLATTTRRKLEGQPGVQAPLEQTWSKAQLLASDADRNYNGADAVIANAEPAPGIELPADQRKASAAFGYAYVRLSAGYGGRVGQIFEGTMLIPSSKRIDPVTWETTLMVGDGALGAKMGVANTSFPAGTQTLTIVRHLLRLLGVGTGNLDEASWQRVLAAGQRQAGKPYQTSSKIAWSYSPSGQSAWRDLALMLELSNVKWIIDAGDFFLLEPDGYLGGAAVDLGRPIGAIEDKGGGRYQGLFLLNQNARPAGKITIDSAKYRGEFIARSVAFIGDTHEGGFNTAVEFSTIDPLGLGL